MAIFRQKITPVLVVLMQVLVPKLECGNVCLFVERKTGEPGEPGEKPSEQVDNEQQTQPTYDTWPESNVGGALHHPSSTKSQVGLPFATVRMMR